jgi:hypothetical protein
MGHRSHQQRIAVRDGLGDEIGRYRAAGARPIVDDELLPCGFGQALCVEASHDIDAAAGRKPHQDTNGFRGIRSAGRRLCDREPGIEQETGGY